MKSTKTRLNRTGEDEALSKGPKWIRVIAERFDWLIGPSKMKSFKKGQIAYEPHDCVVAGLRAGAIEVIDKPANARVGKDGRVIFDVN